MQKVNMREAKIHLSRYVVLAAGGVEFLIVRRGGICFPPSCTDSRAIATEVLGTGTDTFQDS